MKLIPIDDIDTFLSEPIATDHNFANLYRGEFNRYPSRLPAYWRVPESDRPVISLRNFGVMRVFLELFILPKIRYSFGVPLYNNEFFGAMDLCHSVGEPDLRQISWQITALLQHYGFLTEFLDITFSKKVAMFFACYNSRIEDIDYSGIGYIYHWNQHDICRQFTYTVILAELSTLSSFLNHESLSVTCRPVQQVAGCIRIPTHKLQEFDNLSTAYLVDRSMLPRDMFSVDYFFPLDNVPRLIQNAVASWKDETTKSIQNGLIEHSLVDIFKAAIVL